MALPQRALIVDDDADMSGLIARCLSLWGWTTHESRSASAALVLFERGEYDLAICDVEMPGGSGISLAQNLLKAKPSLRVLMVSGNPENLEQAEKSGLGAGLRKPFDLDALKALVENIQNDGPSQAAGNAARSPLP